MPRTGNSRSFARRRWLVIGLSLCLLGCAPTRLAVDVNGLPIVVASIENPLFVAAADREFLWNQVVDTIDDYFRIEREDRVRQIQNVLLEGRIQTFPQIGSTLLEPWRKDSTPGFEKLHATLQTVRRRASVRVTPTEGGSFIEVIVLKELEDVQRPERASVGLAAKRHDGSLTRADEQPDSRAATRGWIPQGRDISLEQQILFEIRGRVGAGLKRLPAVSGPM